MAIGADAYTEIIASTREAIDTQELVDQVITQHPLLEIFKGNARSYTGRAVNVNVEGAENGSTSFTDASGTFSTSVDSDLVGTATFGWSQPLVSKTRLAFSTIQMNQGKEQIVDLVKSHLKAAEKGHAKTLAQALYDDSPASGAPDSLPVLVGTGGTVGGIRGGNVTAAVTNKALTSDVATLTCADGHTFEVGDSVVVAGVHATFNGTFTITAVTSTTFSYAKTASDVASAAVSPAGTATVSAQKQYWNSPYLVFANNADVKAAFRETLNTLFVQGDGSRPTHILAGIDVYEMYESALDEAARAIMTANPSTIDGRFRELRFDGLTVRLDPDCPAREAYFLNKDDLLMGYLGDNWMKVQPAQAVPGTLDYVTPIASVVVFGVRQRRSHARIRFNA